MVDIELRIVLVAMVTYVCVLACIGGELVAYLPLQVALFFNVCFSPVWFLSSLVAQLYKVNFDSRIENTVLSS